MGCYFVSLVLPHAYKVGKKNIHGVLSEIRFLNVSCLQSPGELVKICRAVYIISRNIWCVLTTLANTTLASCFSNFGQYKAGLAGRLLLNEGALHT